VWGLVNDQIFKVVFQVKSDHAARRQDYEEWERNAKKGVLKGRQRGAKTNQWKTAHHYIWRTRKAEKEKTTSKTKVEAENQPPCKINYRGKKTVTVRSPTGKGRDV